MRFLLALVPWLLAASAAEADELAADLELALAVDASGSVDDDEFRLQLGGIASGFRDPAVRAAIRSGPNRRIAVNLLIWAEPQVPKDMTNWHVIASDEDAERFAALVERLPRSVTGATGMGEGVSSALRAFDGNGLASPREVVDVSGDGAETPAREYVVMMPQARAMAAARGVTVNGLAILGSEPGLVEWYAKNVVVGRDSFLMTAAGYGDFAEAMRRKLLKEIEYQPRLSNR